MRYKSFVGDLKKRRYIVKNKKGRLILRKLPQKYVEVLLHIAKKGAKTKYEIEGETDISHASIFEAVKFFEEIGVLEGQQIGVTRVGLPLKKFKFTLQGLYIALKYANLNDYEKIIEKWKHLSPYIFNKYNYLNQKLGKKEAGLFFHRYLRDVGDTREIVTPKELIEECVYETIFWYKDEYDRKEKPSEEWNRQFDKWINTFKENLEFRNIVMDFINSEIEYYKKSLEWIEFVKNKMET